VDFKYPLARSSVMPKVFVSRLFHETHSFVDDVTSLEQFVALPKCRLGSGGHDGSPLGGAMETFRDLGWEIIPGPDYTATPSGVVRHEVFERYWSDLEKAWNADFE